MTSTPTTALTDRYELLEVLGGSALAATHLARDRSTGALRAVKVPRAHVLADAPAIDRFRAVLGRVQALSHPNILPIREIGGAGSDLWIVSDLAEAPALKDLLHDGIALGRMLEIAADVAEALGAAHQAGVVHGDIRPSNIFVAADGAVRLADFGIATLAQAIHPLMRTSLLTPMPAYLAPEVARGGAATARSDIYSLGMLLYGEVTGHLPFSGFNIETVRVKQDETPILPPSVVNPGLPAAIDGLMAKALAWRPEDRHASAVSLAHDLRELRAALAREPAALLVPPEDVRALTPAHTPSRIGPERAETSAPLTGTRLCPACGTPNAPEALYCTECWRSLGAVPVLTTAEERSLSLAFRQRARRARLLRRGLLAVGVLALIGVLFFDRSAPPGLLAGPPASSLTSAQGPGLWTSPGNGATGTASLRVDGPLPTGNPRWQVELGSEVLSSPTIAGGRIFITTQDRRVLALAADDGRVLWELPATGPLDVSPVVAGDKVYVAFRDSTLLALEAATGKAVWQKSLKNPVFTWMAVDKGILYALPMNGTIQTFDAQTGDLRWELSTPYKLLAPPTIADDRLVVPTMDGRVLVLNGKTGATGLIFLVRRSVEGAAAISGDIAVFGGNERSVRAINIHARNLPLEKTVLKWWAQFYIWQIAPFPPAQSGTVWARTVPSTVRSSPSIAGNRAFAATSDGILYALSLVSGDELWRVPLQEGKAVPGSPIAVNDVVYIGTDRGTLHAMDAATGDSLWRFQAAGPISSSPAFANGTLYVVTQNGVLHALD